MKRSRPAFTLIEMLVVMAVTGVLITSGIAFMAGLMRLEGMTSRSMTANMIIPRLVSRWRDDVHAASALPAAHEGDKAGPGKLILQCGKATVVYTTGPEWVERATTGPGPKMERYALAGAGSSARFGRRGNLAMLIIEDNVKGVAVPRCEAMAAIGMSLPAEGGGP